MSVVHHGTTDVHGPYFRIGKAALQGHRGLTAAAADFQNSTHLALVRYRSRGGHAGLDLILIVLTHEEAVGAIVIDPAGHGIAHVAAGLDVNLMPGVVRDVHVGLELQRARTLLLGCRHLAEVDIHVGIKVLLQARPHELLGR